MIGDGNDRGWKEKMREERKDSEDLFYDPGYVPVEHAWENLTATVTSCYSWGSRHLPY